MQAFKSVEPYVSEAPYDVILSGPISGVPDFRERFARAYVRVRDEFRREHGREARVWNPAALPQDRDYAWYMAACHAAIFASPDATLWQLEGWSDSPGSRSEHALALSLGLRVQGLRA